MSSRSSWLKNFLEGKGGIFVTNFLPSSCFCSLTLCPLQSCVFWESASRITSGLFFFSLSPIKKALSRVALNLQQIAKKWLKGFSAFCAPGAEWDARQWRCQPGLFSADCQGKEARGKEERKEIAQGWGHALHLFFLLICTVCIHPGSPHLAKPLRAAGSSTPVCSLSLWSVVQPLAEHVERKWLSVFDLHLQVRFGFCIPILWLSRRILAGERWINPWVLHSVLSITRLPERCWAPLFSW